MIEGQFSGRSSQGQGVGINVSMCVSKASSEPPGLDVSDLPAKIWGSESPMSELGPSLTKSAEADFRPRRDHGISFRVWLRILRLSVCDSKVTFDDEADAFAKEDAKALVLVPYPIGIIYLRIQKILKVVSW